MASRRSVRVLAAAGVVLLVAQLPFAQSGATPLVASETRAWVAPERPDLTKCRAASARSTDPCRAIVERYGRHVARLAAVARGGSSRLAQNALDTPVSDPCPKPAFDGATCGHVDVPLDRSFPASGTIAIHFELYTHTDPGPAESAILVNFGGPGGGTTPNRGGAFFLFGENLDAHDLLLIDDRGRGLSEAIDCPLLQGAGGTIAEQIAECASILGAAASRYGSGEVAQDTDDVRAALGYDLIDYYGVSYGGADISAYATRFPQHIRTLILDAPWGDTQIREEFVDAHLFVDSTLDVIRRLCQRSPSCRSERTDPVGDFERLVKRVRQQPVVGNGYTPYGERIHSRVDPEFIVQYLMLRGGPFVNDGELAAASAALRKGDSAPLLRLAAEFYYPICCLEEPEPFPLRFFSGGSFVATYCVDNEWEWNWNSTVADRMTQHATALEAAPPETFAPFTGDEVSVSVFVGTPLCMEWPTPVNPAPIAIPGAAYPDVPTLVIGGDLDNVVPLQQTKWIAELFPGSTYVPFVSAGHGAAFSDCGAKIVSRFVETQEPGNVACARKPQAIYPSVGEFPLTAHQASPAKIDAGEGNRANPLERKVVAVAAATVKDALARAQLAFFGPGKAAGRGLRGGRLVTRFEGNGGEDWVIRLKDVRFAEDVIVNGTIHWPPSPKIRVNLQISGVANGSLSLRTDEYLLHPGGIFTVTGVLNGRRVAVIVPQA